MPIPKNLIKTGIRQIKSVNGLPGVDSQYRTLGRLLLGQNNPVSWFPSPLNPLRNRASYIEPTMLTPSNDAIRTIYRERIGIPSGSWNVDDMTIPQVRSLLMYPSTNGIGAINLNTLNRGLNQRDLDYMDSSSYRRLLGNAVDRLYNLREVYPYNSLAEALEERPMFRVSPWRSRAPEAALEPAIRNAILSGEHIPSVYQSDARLTSRNMFNNGEISESNPLIQEQLNNFRDHITESGLTNLSRVENPEDLNEVIANTLHGSLARDNSQRALNNLYPFISKRISPIEQKKLFEKMLPPIGINPDGSTKWMTISDLTKEQKKTFGEVIERVPLLTRRINMDFWNKVGNLQPLPNEEKVLPIMGHAYNATRGYPLKKQLKAISDMINNHTGIKLSSGETKNLLVKSLIKSAYSPPKIDENSAPITPFDEQKLKVISEELKNRTGINLSPDEMKILFNVDNPNNIALAERLRKAGYEVLPGDAQHLSWFQVRNSKDLVEDALRELDLSKPEFDSFTPAQKNFIENRAESILKNLAENQAKIKAGLQGKLLLEAIPRKHGIFEPNESVNSYNLEKGITIGSPNYGTGPGQVQLVKYPDREDMVRTRGNALQLNRIRYKDGVISSDLNVPGINGAFKAEELSHLIGELSLLTRKEQADVIRQNPEYTDLITRVLDVAKTLNMADIKSVGQTFKKINKKHANLGLETLKAPWETELPLYPEMPDFYNEDNIDALYNLLSDINDGARHGGWAQYMNRTPIMSLKNKQGGIINFK